MQHAERERELTVLVVDDDEEMRNLLKDVLNDALRPGGVRLIEASSATHFVGARGGSPAIKKM